MRSLRILRRTETVALGVLLASLAMLALASTASAARTYESQILGPPPDATVAGPFSEPWGIAFDSADNAWIADPGDAGVISVFDPANNFLSQEDGDGHFDEYSGGYIRSVAINHSSGYLYVADSGNVVVKVFDAGGNFVEEWSITGGYDYAAVDNSGGPANGRVYVARASGSVRAYDPAGNPVNYTESAGYISGNDITGTPTNSFSNPWGVAVGTDGHIFVVDSGRRVVDEYQSSGLFVREFTGTPGGEFMEPTGVATDPTSDTVLIVDSVKGTVEEFEPNGVYLGTITGEDTPAGSFVSPRNVAVNSSGYVYISDAGNHVVDIFSPDVVLPKVNYTNPTNPTQTSGTLNATIDPNGGGDVIECALEFGPTAAYGTTIPCSPAIPPNYSAPTDVSADVSGLTTEQTYHYRFAVSNANGTKKGGDQQFVPHAVIGLLTNPATNIGPIGATLNGSWVGNGEDTHYYFQWGASTSYGNVTAAPPGVDAGSGTGSTQVSFDLGGLSPITTYHYRIVAENSAGVSTGQDQSFTTPPNAPLIEQWVTTVHSDSAVLHAEINPGGGATKYHFEWGTADCASNPCASGPIPDAALASSTATEKVSKLVTGLSAGTTYHYRVVAENLYDVTESGDRTFTTFPHETVIEDTCANSHVRQQTGSALLLDCRAYELVSARDSGGYDVESDLIAGQTPFRGYPQATEPSRVLYSVYKGAIPGTGHPTNFGPDPYVATRGPSGWSTAYVGLPADTTPSDEPFGSVLAEANSTLSTFAFGGSNLCSPCFEDGKTGIPLHMSDGSIVQGMQGSLDPGPSAAQAGFIGRRLSADGTRLVFGSSSKFEQDGNSNGDVTIYKRDLASGVTRVVSKTPGGMTMTGPGIAELDMSSDGSRVIVAQLVSTDAEGNDLWHPYMTVGNSTQSIDLAPGATAGVLYDGMTADGTSILFTSSQQLTGDDNDSSADIFRATVGSASATLERVSTGSGGSGDTDACDPDLNLDRPHWNTVGIGLNCNAVAIAGTAGTSPGGGTIYFLSPEKLDGASNGAQDEPNLYTATPGAAPRFVATLEPDNPVVRHAIADAEIHRYGDFQVSRGGDYAVFTSTLPLTGYSNDSHSEVYRYAAPGEIDCASCPPTGVLATNDATLPAQGLGLTDDGRVFFTSSEPLAPSDNNEKSDAYEWKLEEATGKAKIGLISTGLSLFDSRLLSVSADGTDAHFFTRDNLVPEDLNGHLVKIYDARSDGGFPSEVPATRCQASDECHGPGSEAPPPPNISNIPSGQGNVRQAPRKSCGKGRVRRKGKCVKRTREQNRHHTRRSHGNG
jgi:hypothetical protein